MGVGILAAAAAVALLYYGRVFFITIVIATIIAFLLEPTTIEQVAAVAFSGGVMPQKSTDFYPKLLSGLTIYKLER